MAIVTIDPLSQVPLFVRLRFGDTELAVATAFFFRRGGRLYLISNWHNFSGRNPITRAPLADHGGVPDTASCYACLAGPYIQRRWLDLALTYEGQPLWYEHPTLGSTVDIAALPVALTDEFQAFPINEVPFAKMELRVSHDVFVLGYPLGFVDGTGLPIWKRATVASEPGTSAPSFLIDTATRAGMSGSPVIQRYRGFYKKNHESTSAQPDDWFGEGDAFVGVYSGRVREIDAEAHLGIVWKASLINEVVDGARHAMS